MRLEEAGGLERRDLRPWEILLLQTKTSVAFR